MQKMQAENKDYQEAIKKLNEEKAKLAKDADK